MPSIGSSGSSSGKILIAVQDRALYARVVGLGTANNAIAFQDLQPRLVARGIVELFVDLAECEGFDSTFMGILAGAVQRGGRVLLLNASPEHRRLLAEVGIDRLVACRDEPTPSPDLALEPLDSHGVTPESRLRAILEAHEALVRENPKNYARFGAFIESMRREFS